MFGSFCLGVPVVDVRLRLCSSLQGEIDKLQVTGSSFVLGHVTPAVAGFKVCHICFQKCRTSSELRRHHMTHTGEKPFRCPHCLYSSALKTNVKRHMVCLHKSEYPVICTSDRTSNDL